MTEEQMNKIQELERDLREARSCHCHNRVKTTYTKLPGISVSMEEDVHTPTVSPNNSFNDDNSRKLTDISPSLRNLGPGFVSNLAGFWALKVNSIDPYFWQNLLIKFILKAKIGEDQGRLSPGDCSEILLNESGSAISEDDLENSHKQDSAADHLMMMKNLQEDKSKLFLIIEEMKAEGEVAAKELHDLEIELENKNNQIKHLKESLNTCNEKLSAMLKEDLEKNYKIIELEAANEDFMRIQTEQRKEIHDLKEALDQSNARNNADSNLANIANPDDDETFLPETYINDDKLRTDLNMLENDVNLVISQCKGAKRGRLMSTETDKSSSLMMQMMNLRKSAKKRRTDSSSPDSSDANVWDSSMSSPSDTIQETSLSTGTQEGWKTLRSSLRMSKKRKEEPSRRKTSVSIFEKLRFVKR